MYIVPVLGIYFGVAQPPYMKTNKSKAWDGGEEAMFRRPKWQRSSCKRASNEIACILTQGGIKEDTYTFLFRKQQIVMVNDTI